jgi:N-acyl-L-homoserine lactone synthetase
MQLISADHYAYFLDAVTAMHRLRYRVFKERLDWDVQFSGDMEIDEFDTLHPAYLIQRARDKRVQGCVRLLPSTGPTMRAILFPYYWTERRSPPLRPFGRAVALHSIFILTRRRQLTAWQPPPTNCSRA